MKSAVETLSPTRVRLTIEVPFEELNPSVERAYRTISQQVQVPGFRKGKVPPRLIDQRIGRAAVLEQAVNEALPQFYGQAVEQNHVHVIGQPELEVTKFADGEPLEFTVEVDIRPEIALPELDGLEVQVDDVEVADSEIDEQVEALRARFGTLTPVDRPVQEGDFVSIDLAASIDGEVLDDGTANGMSYEVGSGDLIEGLDEALTGMSAGDAKTFQAPLVGGEHAGEQADVAVTVQSVKVRELPALDDDFAQMASEFDTVDELRDDVRTRLERVKRLQQGAQARDRVLEKLIEITEVPVPEGALSSEVQWRHDSLGEQLQQAGLTLEQYLETDSRSVDEHNADVEKRAGDSIKAQFLLDEIAEKEEIGVDQNELTDHLVRRAMQAGTSPDQFAQQVVESGNVGLLVGEVRRGKALAYVLERAKVVDASGNEVDLNELDELARQAQAAGMMPTDPMPAEMPVDDEIDEVDDEGADDASPVE